MSEDSYKNREIDKMFLAVHDRFDAQDQVLKSIESKQDYTNGKVKKIIIVLVLVVGFMLGISGKEILPLIASLIL